MRDALRGQRFFYGYYIHSFMFLTISLSTIHYPQSTIRNPQSPIHYSKSSIHCHYPLSTIQCPLSTIQNQLLTIKYQPSTIYYLLSTIYYLQSYLTWHLSLVTLLINYYVWSVEGPLPVKIKQILFVTIFYIEHTNIRSPRNILGWSENEHLDQPAPL